MAVEVREERGGRRALAGGRGECRGHMDRGAGGMEARRTAGGHRRAGKRWRSATSLSPAPPAVQRHPPAAQHYPGLNVIVTAACAAAGGKAELGRGAAGPAGAVGGGKPRDRKSTRLNSSHVKISYAVFGL